MPRNEGEPFSYSDPNTAWWRSDTERESDEALAEAAAARPRHPRRRPAPTAKASTRLPAAYGGAEPAFAPEATDAHAAGVHDVAQALDPPPAVLVEAEQEDTIEDIEAVEPVALERHHDRLTRERFLPPEPLPAAEPQAQTEQGYAMSTADETTAPEPAPDRTHAEDTAAATDLPDLGHRPEGVPDVMVLPEPQRERDRPTVPLDRGPVPGQPPSGLSRLGQARTHNTEASIEAARQRMENSPFWLTDEERAAAGADWPAPEVRSRLAEDAGPADDRRGQPPRRKPRSPRRPVPGLFGLVVLGLIAAFFSWVSAEPFWLAVGHGDAGSVTVSQCIGSGVTQRCTGTFAAADGSFTAPRVALLGVDASSRDTGAVAPARMVSPDSRQAYVGTTGLLVHLRWTLGFVLVLLCGYGIAGTTGARRLETARARRGAVLVSLAGPVLLLVGFLVGAY
jgi:hypothetical protein